MRNEYINTIARSGSNAIVIDECLVEGAQVDYPRDIRLNRMILNDLDFGVGQRPTLPCCFDDDEDIKNGEFDGRADIKFNPWDDAAAKCNPVGVIPPPVDPDPTPTDVE